MGFCLLVCLPLVLNNSGILGSIHLICGVSLTRLVDQKCCCVFASLDFYIVFPVTWILNLARHKAVGRSLWFVISAFFMSSVSRLFLGQLQFTFSQWLLSSVIFLHQIYERIWINCWDKTTTFSSVFHIRVWNWQNSELLNSAELWWPPGSKRHMVNKVHPRQGEAGNGEAL